MSVSSVYCNLCCRAIGKRNKRVLPSKGWKQFDVFTEIESLEIYLCDRSKTSTSAETVLRISDSDQHLLEALTIKSTSPRFSREQVVRRAINKRRIAVRNPLDYFDVLLVSNRDRWHSHVVWMSNLVFNKRSQRRYYNEDTEQSISSERKAL